MSQIVYGASVQLSIYLPEVLIATIVFSLHCGVYPLTFILIPEIIPEKVLEILFVSQIILEVKISRFLLYFQVRIYGVSLTTSFLWILMLTFSMNEQIIGEYLQHKNGSILLGCILFNLLGSFILWILVPSTRRKSYSDIFCSLSSK